ncbi:endo-1,3-1,4-beta glucanase-related protein [Bacteroidia bacterium]|nr:endo-1,3-1,4-beta glucanase-related protein [Bacteroidia bacterium]
MKKNIIIKATWVALISSICVSINAQEKEYPKQEPMRPGMSEYWTPQPKVVTPGAATASAAITAPSDAIILFDGKDLSKWENSKGEAAGWTVHDGVFTVNKKDRTGDIQTKQKFENYQLHIEWQIPADITGTNQARGNSGVFNQGLYEVQILDTYNNETYVNGSTGSIYKQTPPLVNAMRKPGEWNVYDIIYSAPIFKEDGTYRVPPYITVIHNGVLLQNHTAILGTTEYIGFPTVKKHGAGPIILQNHGDRSEPVSFRNIWIREL